MDDKKTENRDPAGRFGIRPGICAGYAEVPPAEEQPPSGQRSYAYKYKAFVGSFRSLNQSLKIVYQKMSLCKTRFYRQNSTYFVLFSNQEKLGIVMNGGSYEGEDRKLQ